MISLMTIAPSLSLSLSTPPLYRYQQTIVLGSSGVSPLETSRVMRGEEQEEERNEQPQQIGKEKVGAFLL